jgi:hypothetical protein
MPAAAEAHAKLVKSEPAKRASLERPPAAVRLWFNEEVEPAASRIVVTDVAGTAVTFDPAHVAADDPKLLELALPSLGPGRYLVTFEILSLDGHRVTQSYSFSVRTPPAPKPR